VSARDKKKSIRPLRTSASKAIEKLTFNEFEYIDENIPGKHVGFIIDEIEQIKAFEDCVIYEESENDNLDEKLAGIGLDLHKINIYGLKAIQELLERVEKLEKMIQH